MEEKEMNHEKWGEGAQEISRKLMRSKCKIYLYVIVKMKLIILHNECMLIQLMTNKTIKLQLSRQ